MSPQILTTVMAHINVQGENAFFFSVRELKKVLRGTLTRAALSATIANQITRLVAIMVKNVYV